ncbi:hypothetical protein YC2023_072266 [Brassica napus]
MFSTQLRSSSKKNQIKRSSYVIVMLFTNQVIFSSREFRPPEKLEMANLLSDEPTVNSIMPKVIIHVLNVQKSIGLDGFQKDSKTSLFSPNGETDKILAKRKDGFRPGLKGTFLGPYQEYILHLSKSCFLVRLSPSFDPSFVGPVRHIRQRSKFMMFGLQRKSNKDKHPRLSVSQTSFKYALNTFDEFVDVQEKPIWWSKEHVNTSKDVADPKRQHFQFDVQQICDNLVKGVDKALKDFNKSQKKSTSTRAPVAEPSLFISKKAQGESENHFEELKDFSDSLPIFDESDEELIESLMFCEKDCDLPSLETEFNLDNEQAIVELTFLQPELPSSLVLSPQVFEEEPLDFPHQCPCLDTRICLDDELGPIFDEEDELGPVFDEEATSIISTFMESHLCFDSGTTTAPSSPAPLLHDLQEHCEEPSSLNSLPDMVVKVSTDDPDLLSFETDNTWHFLRSFRDNGVVLSSDDILVYNTFFEKCLELLINDSQTELKLVCSDVGKDMPILKMNTVVAYLDKILVCNIYFDEHLERLKNERQVQPLNESIGRAKQPQIWRSFVVQTGYLGASDRGSVQEGYLYSPKVFCLESNFTRKPTHQGFTEAWNRMKIFTDGEVMNFPNRRFFSPTIREYQISKGDSCPRKNRPEPKPILNEPKVFPQSTSWPNQKHSWPNFKIDKPIFGDQLTCLSLSHVLDDYPKGLDPDLDDKHDQFPRKASAGECLRTYVLRTWNWKYLREANSKLQGSFCKIDLRSNPFEEGGNDVPWGSAPGKTDMHGLIIGSSNDICSLFDLYLLNHEASTHEITWRMFSTQLRSSSKKNQIKRSSYVIVMLFTNQVIFSSREFRPPEKLEMANLLSDEPTVNSIMPKVIIHVLNVQKSIGLDGFQKDSKTSLFSPNGETDKILAKRKDGFRPGLKGTFLGPYQEYILHLSKSCFLVRLSPSFDPSFVGPVRHIRQRSKSGSIFGLFRNP